MWNLFGKQQQPPPPVVPGDQVVPLPEHDDTHINRSLILDFMLRFDSVLDPQKLNSSLNTLLSRPGWRKIGARLRLNVCEDTGDRSGGIDYARWRRKEDTNDRRWDA